MIGIVRIVNKRIKWILKILNLAIARNAIARILILNSF
jgi:hypothetical protein